MLFVFFFLNEKIQSFEVSARAALYLAGAFLEPKNIHFYFFPSTPIETVKNFLFSFSKAVFG